MRALTVKQQAKHRARAFRLLTAIGFKVQGPSSSPFPGQFYWLKVGNDKRVCVAFDVIDQCSGGRTGWVWQTADLTGTPLFGYSGTCGVGSMWATCDRIISITLERIRDTGFFDGLMVERTKITKIKEALASTLAAI